MKQNDSTPALCFVVSLIAAAQFFGVLNFPLTPSKLHAQESDTTTIQKLRLKIEDLKLDLAKREEIIAELKTAETLDRPVHPEVRRLRRTVQELRTTVKRRSETLKQLRNQNVEGGGSEELQRTIETLKQRNQRLKEQLQDVRKMTDERKRKLQQLQTQLQDVKEAEATKVGGEVTITLDESILFKIGEATLKQNAKSTLDKLTDVFQKYENYRILVEGHTDDVPVGGRTFGSNWSLSVLRAANVVEYIQSNSTIPGDRLMAAGMGPYDPVAPNDTPKDRAKNRRVEIKLIPIGHLKQDRPSRGDTAPRTGQPQ